MIEKNLPIIILVASFILIIIDMLTTENISDGFWIRSSSNILLILAMTLTIKDRRKSKEQ